MTAQDAAFNDLPGRAVKACLRALAQPNTAGAVGVSAAVSVDFACAPAHARACVAALAPARLQPLLWRCLQTSGQARDWPPDSALTLEAAYKTALSAQMLYQQAFLEILDACAVPGLCVLPLKGLYLAEKVYPAPGTRPMSDLDIFVTEQQFRSLARILESLGYTCDLQFLAARGRGLPSGATFQHAARGIHVDAHYSLLNEKGIRGLLLGTGQIRRLNAQALERAVSRPYLGRAIPVLSAPDFLLSLMLHHYTHNFSGLLWFLDAIFMARTLTHEDWSVFAAALRDNGLERAAGLWFRLASVNFDCAPETFLPPLMARMSRDAGQSSAVFGHAVRHGRLDPLSALALVPGASRRTRALARAFFPSRAYLEEISHKPVPANQYLKELIIFQKRLLLR